jgi:hypothetical protein
MCRGLNVRAFLVIVSGLSLATFFRASAQSSPTTFTAFNTTIYLEASCSAGSSGTAFSGMIGGMNQQMLGGWADLIYTFGASGKTGGSKFVPEQYTALFPVASPPTGMGTDGFPFATHAQLGGSAASVDSCSGDSLYIWRGNETAQKLEGGGYGYPYSDAFEQPL